MKSIKRIVTGLTLFAPGLALADIGQAITTVDQLLNSVLGWLNFYIIPIFIALGVVAFAWGIIVYLWSGADETKKKDARRVMVWGLIGIFVMVSIWGLVRFLQKSFGIDANTTITPPTLNLPR